MHDKMEALFPLVADLARRESGCESTSVTYEKAQTLMGAVLYCLAEYEQARTNSPAPAGISVRERYDTGRRLVLEKAAAIREIFHELSPCFDDYGVRCLYETVRKGIPQFLKWYDARFCPQNTVITLDYPLLADCSHLQGADAVWQYLCGIRAEQRFLQLFDRVHIIHVLREYSAAYREMIENISGIVLANAVGHMALRKPFADTGFREAEYARLSDLFGAREAGETEEMVRQLIRAMTERLDEGGEEVYAYLCCGAGDLAVRIELAASQGHLERIFLI